jgi:hypothetical protein
MKHENNYSEHENNRDKGLEYFILLVLGSGENRISLLHIQKEIFLLWNFHPSIREYLVFIKHYKGPFSRAIENVILHPFYLDNCWIYEGPSRSDKLSSGYIVLTIEGTDQYHKLYNEAKNNESLRSLLTGIKMVHSLYDKLSPEELLLLIYDTYPEYTEKSNVSQKILQNKNIIAKKMISKGLIDEIRYNSIIEGNTNV